MTKECVHFGQYVRNVAGRVCGVRGIPLPVHHCHLRNAECMPIEGGYAIQCCKRCEHHPYYGPLLKDDDA